MTEEGGSEGVAAYDAAKGQLLLSLGKFGGMRWEVGAVGDGWDGKLVDSVRDGWEVRGFRQG